MSEFGMKLEGVILSGAPAKNFRPDSLRVAGAQSKDLLLFGSVTTLGNSRSLDSGRAARPSLGMTK
jgi:hypothetical protein